MNKKIIYISGGENANPDDIRVAMDEVRNTLNLSPDTVLFGVPVDETNDTQIETAPDTCKTDEPAVIPILSVLSVNESRPVCDESIIAPIITDDSDFMATPVAPVTIAEPIIDTEQTLEELLEKIAPLREPDIVPKSEPVNEPEPESDADVNAVLEKLATEFVAKQDEIEPAPKSGGKIGKLKNILPFKKSKREDTGLMGDLFGWAGIAANDDEFTIPGFFTTTK